jgi:hypothetical protein
MGGHVARMEQTTNIGKISVEKHGGKRPFGRPSYRCEVNIRIDVRETGYEVVELIQMG